jgi:hypothetical protein
MGPPGAARGTALMIERPRQGLRALYAAEATGGGPGASSNSLRCWGKGEDERLEP